MYSRPWGTGSALKSAYKYTNKDKNRMGNCDWLPKEGDMCLCVQHSGDYFYNYIAVRKQKDGTFKKVGKFGAYCFGDEYKISERVFHLLLAGCQIKVKFSKVKVKKEKQMDRSFW